MKINEVNNKQDLKRFVEFPCKLYKGNRYYVTPLLSKELKTFHPKHNPLFTTGQTKLWLVKDHHKVVGRVAAFIQKKELNEDHGPVVKFGWFDAENKQEVATFLFEAVEQWAKSIEAKLIHGPLGYTSFDRSGVLVEGFDETPTIFSCYNHDYYAGLLEKEGFTKEYDWVEYLFNTPSELPLKITRGAEIVKQRYGIELIKSNTITDLKKYKEDVRKVLNESYAGLNGFSALSKQQFDILFSDFSNLIVPEFTSLIKDSLDNLIGFGIALPSYSEAFRKMKGKILPYGLWYLRRAKKKVKTADLLLIAIKPKYQRKGGHALILNEVAKNLISKNVKLIESTKELESNSQIQNLWKDYDFRQHKRSRCYIKELV